MATPRGAKHQDLEQRLRDLEAQVRELTAATLRRKQLKVDQGDFVVAGGGDVVVKDRGQVLVMHPNGMEAVLLGDMYAEPDEVVYNGTGVLVQDETGQDIFQARTDAAGAGYGQVVVRDRQGNIVMNDDPSGYGMAVPHLQVPMYPARTLDSNGGALHTTTDWAASWEGAVECWSPYLDVRLALFGTEGRYRISLDGVVVVPSTLWSGGSTYVSERIDLRSYPHGSERFLQIEAHTTSGGPNVSVKPVYVRLGQS